MKPRMPLDYIGVTKFYSNTHRAIDFGWHDYEGEPVYAALSGTVVLAGKYSDAGNTIVLKSDYEGETIITRYLHLQYQPTQKVGEKIAYNQLIGYMGKTGQTTGTHLHFEYWICPKNYTYKFSDQAKYAKDPLKYCYVYPDQRVSNSDKDQVLYVNDIQYVIIKGDTLSAIAKKHNTTYQELARYNKIDNPNLIYAGDIINIPVDKQVIYTVVKGDSLSKIAFKYNKKANDLYNDNKKTIGPDPNKIYPGQKLVIK